MKKKQWAYVKREDLAYEGQIEALRDGFCPGIFQAEVVMGQEGYHLCYDVEGFLSVRIYGEHHEIQAEEALVLLWNLMEAMELCQTWLWFPEEYVLSLDTLWIDRWGNIKILWIPDRKKVSGKKKLNYVIVQLKKIVTLEAKEYLAQVEHFLETSYGKPGEVKWFFDELLTELHILRVN